MSVSLNSVAAYVPFLQQQHAVAVYFSAPDCAVCSVLKPRVFAALRRDFPRLVLAEVDSVAVPEVAAQCGVFSVPTLIVYFAGQELLRKVRNFSPAQLAAELQRPYALFFED